MSCSLSLVLDMDHPELQQYIAFFNELKTEEAMLREFVNPRVIEERKRELSQMICQMEEETCGPCLLEKVCVSLLF